MDLLAGEGSVNKEPPSFILPKAGRAATKLPPQSFNVFPISVMAVKNRERAAK